MSTDDELTEQLHNLVTWHLRCGPACHGFVHEEYVFTERLTTATEEQIMVAVAAGLAQDCGVRVLDVVRDDAAPHGQEHADVVTGTVVRVAALGHDLFAGEVGPARDLDPLETIRVGVPGETTGYRVRFVSPWPLNAVRRHILEQLEAFHGILIPAGDHVA